MAQPFSLLSACLQQTGQLRASGLERTADVLLAEEERHDGNPLTANMKILEVGSGAVWFLLACPGVGLYQFICVWMVGLMIPSTPMCMHLIFG